MTCLRSAACLLLAASLGAAAQSLPGQPGLPNQINGQQPYPAPDPPPPAAAWGAPGPPAPASSQLPHRGQLTEPPTSAAANRDADKPTVTLREFRSSAAEVTPRGATDMFIAALVRSHRFRVVERARISEGIATEKALNQQGMTTGQLGQRQYLGATYLFEATISEASMGEHNSAFSLGVAGATAGRSRSSDSLAIDVRMIDVESGVVIDAVTARRTIPSVETRVQGVTSALANLVSPGGHLASAMPTDQYVDARKQSVDKALREAIEEAVAQIVQHLEQH